MKTKTKKYSEEEVESIKNELNDKYIRLYAEFENFKRRSQKEKEDIKNMSKVDTLSTVLDIDNDMSIASKKISDKVDGLDIIMSKLDRFLKSHGIESIQTDKYDPEIHEAISVLETGQSKILDVVNKGYTLNGKIIRHPKVIISK